MDNFEKIAKVINDAEKIVFLTGAGISTDSGIPDFKSADKEWKFSLPREHFISEDFFRRKPKMFWPIYKDVFKTKVFDNYKPNFGHQFIANLEKMGKQVTVITQNVDGLHKLAGSSDVFEVHGTLQTARCPKCGEVYDLKYIRNNEIPRCSRRKSDNKTCNFILKPDVVLFGGDINYYKESFKVALESDVFIAIGTSLKVGPINQIPIQLYHNLYKDKEQTKIIINKDQTALDYCFDIVINDGITETLKLVNEKLSSL
jgi:NAD-dependent protein deacetylases, SIR2 family